MRVPLEWLKEYVTIRLKPEALAERLTMAGLEVVGIINLAGEPVLDMEITPNRADCLSMIGVAREVATITGQRLKLPSAQGSGLRVRGKGRSPRARSPEPGAPLTVRIEDRKGCSRYIGRLIEGVTLGPSPEWMQRRLIACGARPINNIVDSTNYVLLEYGQPLHAFDYGRLAEGTIVVRRARAQEPITTLDGVRRALTPEMLVIADGRAAVAVAGIMGGIGSEVSPATTAVLLESALFDPVTVRRTARALGLSSESSYRFERGVDPVGVETASVRAAELICALAGGRVRSVHDVGAAPSGHASIDLDINRLNRWLGTRLSPVQIRTTLARLACRVASSDRGAVLRVLPPSFRRDLTMEVDLFEELARMVGYDRIPSTVPVVPMRAEARADAGVMYERVQSVRRVCASLGLTEAITWALVSEHDLAQCGYRTDRAVHLANPLSQDHAYLRPSLLLGLLQAVRRNVTQGAASARFFEVGRVTRPGAPPREELRVGIALSGMWLRDWQATQACDFFRLKGVVESLLSRLCAGAVHTEPATPPWAEPGQGAVLMMNGRAIGEAGQVSRAMAAALDLDHDLWFAELELDGLLVSQRAGGRIQPPPVFPPVKRDLSVLVRDETPFAQLDRAIREAGGTVASRVELVDRYTGTQVPAGKHSLTFSIEYRDPSRTLTAEEVDAVHRRIGETLVSRFGVQIR